MWLYGEVYFLCAKYNAPRVVDKVCEWIRVYKLIMHSPIKNILENLVDRIV